MSKSALRAPFPYFGGKRKVASLVWDRIGDVDNFIEPFCGSAAVLLARPTPPRIETVNDADSFVANFWRATSRDPEAVAAYADGPVNEADLHARHCWLVLSDDARAFRERMRTDPDYFDARVAGWWCWGLCCWIGSGWCSDREFEAEWKERPDLWANKGGGHGVHKNRPRLSTAVGQGVDSLANQLPVLSSAVGVHSDSGSLPKKRPILAAPANESGRRSHHGIGVRAKGNGLSAQMPRLNSARKGDEYYGGLGVHLDNIGDNRRPQLADQFARGRGVHDNDSAGTCAERRAWLIDWFGQLRDRLRTVRVCCGDWRRVCESKSVTTRLGTTGIFFDPPYSDEADRCKTLYGVESGTVAHEVRAYCLERGADPRMRICLAGYAGEGHEDLETAGWQVVAWKAVGGYGNRSEKGRENAARERLWFSPGCVVRTDYPLFD